MKILIVFHTPLNAGYAMSALERLFYNVAYDISKDENNIYFAFRGYNGGKSHSLPEHFKNYINVDPNELKNRTNYNKTLEELLGIDIDIALCFDLPVSGNVVNLLRSSNIEKIVSYWGAEISSINSGFKLFTKRLEVFFRKSKPDLFIFESKAMQELAIYGRGIRKENTVVIHTGVDTSKYSPDNKNRNKYIQEFGIDDETNIAIYSGHMEERKGVRVIIEAIKHIYEHYKDEKWCLLLCGNKPGEKEIFSDLIENHMIKKHVYFCGYREDLNTLLPSCDLGIIASTGWDSFPMSALEMASSGLPVVASNIQGLAEIIKHEETGFLFEVRDHVALAGHMRQIVSDKILKKRLSINARNNVLNNFSDYKHRENIRNTLRNVISK